MSLLESQERFDAFISQGKMKNNIFYRQVFFSLIGSQLVTIQPGIYLLISLFGIK
jgi:hypothetical protein